MVQAGPLGTQTPILIISHTINQGVGSEVMRRYLAIIVLVLLCASAAPAAPALGEDAPPAVPMLDIIEPRVLNSTFTPAWPLIDGVIGAGEWTAAEGTEALHSEMPPAWEETGGHIEPPGIMNDSDCSHRFWSLYDNDFLYFLFNCSDDEVFVDNHFPDNFWRDDSIEICIDGAYDRDVNQRTDEGYEDGDTFNVPADGSQGVTYSFANGNQYARTWDRNKDWYSAAKTYTDGDASYYIIEVAIRLNAISNPTPASIIGLNTGQNDDDDGGLTKEGVIRWQGLDGYRVWENETLWGILYFRTVIWADAGYSTVINQSDTFTFDGSRSNGNHPEWSSRASYNWTFVYEDQEVSLSGVAPSFKFDRPGEYIVTLNVTDGTDQFDTDTVIVGVRDTEDPVARAGPDVTVDQGTTLTLDGSMSTDNHPDFPVCGTFEWLIFETPLVRLWGIQVEHTFDHPGVWTVRLTVTDPTGINSDQDSLNVSVIDTEAPVADAGDDVTVDEGKPVNFDGSNSTDNDWIVKYFWEFKRGDTFYNFTGNPYPYTFPAPGIYNVSLTVWDDYGNSDTDWFTVTVLDVTPPVADAGDVLTFDEDIEVMLNAELSWDNVGIVSYVWEIWLGDVLIADGLEGRKVPFAFEQPGLYDITLKVTDAVGLSAGDTVQYGVRDVTPPHAVAGGDLSFDEDAAVTFSGTASTDNVGIVEYKWTIESATEPTVQRMGVEFSYVFAEPGEYHVTLVCTDAADKWDSDAIVVTIRDITPPVAVAPNPVEIKVGQTVTFDGQASTDNVGIVSYIWRYEMGGVPFEEEGVNKTVQFDSKGNFTITLTVEDAAGNTHSTSFWVLVKKPKTKDDGPGFGLLAVLVAAGAAAAAMTTRRRS